MQLRHARKAVIMQNAGAGNAVGKQSQTHSLWPTAAVTVCECLCALTCFGCRRRLMRDSLLRIVYCSGCQLLLLLLLAKAPTAALLPEASWRAHHA